MTTRELIERLRHLDPEGVLEVGICHGDDYGWFSDLDSVTFKTRRVGLLNPVPVDEVAIVLDTSPCGL